MPAVERQLAFAKPPLSAAFPNRFRFNIVLTSNRRCLDTLIAVIKAGGMAGGYSFPRSVSLSPVKRLGG
jgi:hypothetical protein